MVWCLQTYIAQKEQIARNHPGTVVEFPQLLVQLKRQLTGKFLLPIYNTVKYVGMKRHKTDKIACDIRM